MQYQSIVMEEVISIFLEKGKEGKKQLIEWFLNRVIGEEAKVQFSFMPYDKPEKTKGYMNGSRTRKLKTVKGTLKQKKPQLREFLFKAGVF